jgi:dihydrofolate synthase/folylpolyglutamate synthase
MTLDREITAVERALDQVKLAHPRAIDLSLGRVRTLLAKLGNPEGRLAPVIHVAGTNGKGSTIAFMRAVLEKAGYRVQAFTSPHLVRFNERIRLAGGLIGDEALIAFFDECERANGGADITFFEFITAAAFLAFSRDAADVLLLEVGLGGRLDSTNVVERPALTAITPVSIDHAGFLGDTLAAIAAEKAGIIKPGVPVVIGPQPDEARRVIRARATDVGAPVVYHGEAGGDHGGWSATATASAMSVRVGGWCADLPRPALMGRHQIDNAGLALACLRHLEGFDVGDAAIAAGLAAAVWPGRLQRLSNGSLLDRLPAGAELWLDSGHNPAAGAALAAAFADLSQANARPLSLVTGMMRTKDAAQFLAPFAALRAHVYGVPVPDEETSHPSDTIVAAAAAAGLPARACTGVENAIRTIGTDAQGVAPRVLICGSLYLAGSVLRDAGVRPV